MDGFDTVCDERTIRAERDKARELRKTKYFQSLLDRGICRYCGGRFPKGELTLDHVIPLARGGRSVRGNLVVCCKKCNSEKKYYTPMDIVLRSGSLNVTADDKIPFLRGVFEPFGEVRYLSGRAIANADLKQSHVLITRTRTKVNEELLSGTAVRFVGTATIGYDHIDTAYLEKNGIMWSNAPGCNSASVAQYIVSVLLNCGRALCGRTLGVVGAGHVGSKVAAAGRALGMKVLLNDPPRAEKEGEAAFCGLDELLHESDFVTLHVPLDSVTRDIADREFFAKMKQGALFINSSRGEVVDEAALKEAAKGGRLGGYVLDVWRNEPEIDLELLAGALLATPHIAGYSSDGKANGTASTVRKAAEIFNIQELTEFYPQFVPPPLQPYIVLEQGVELYEALRTAVNTSYDVRQDAMALKRDAGAFENLRGDYGVRREFPAYTVIGGSAEARAALAALGFQLD